MASANFKLTLEEKQKLIDEMNELKGIKKEVNEQKLEVKEKKKTVHAENGPR